jgi:hypothetical protein
MSFQRLFSTFSRVLVSKVILRGSSPAYIPETVTI